MGQHWDSLGMGTALVVAGLSSALQLLLRWWATSMPRLYLSKVLLLGCQRYLVFRLLVLQELSEEALANGLAHTFLAEILGAVFGYLAGGWISHRQIDAFGCALVGAVGSLLPTAVGLVLARGPSPPTSPSSGGGSPTRSPPRALSLLPAPASASALERGRAVVISLATRPTLRALLLAKLATAAAFSVKDSAFPMALAGEFKVLESTLAHIVGGSLWSRCIAAAFVAAPVSRALSPKKFVLLCLAVRASVELSIAVGFLLPLPGLWASDLHTPAAFVMGTWLGGIARAALDTVLSILLAQAVAREERPALLGLDTFIHFFPHLGMPRLGALLYGLGGVPLVWGSALCLTLCSLLALQHAVLPHYRTKEA